MNFRRTGDAMVGGYADFRADDASGFDASGLLALALALALAGGAGSIRPVFDRAGAGLFGGAVTVVAGLAAGLTAGAAPRLGIGIRGALDAGIGGALMVGVRGAGGNAPTLVPALDGAGGGGGGITDGVRAAPAVVLVAAAGGGGGITDGRNGGGATEARAGSGREGSRLPCAEPAGAAGVSDGARGAFGADPAGAAGVSEGARGVDAAPDEPDGASGADAGLLVALALALTAGAPAMAVFPGAGAADFVGSGRAGAALPFAGAG